MTTLKVFSDDALAALKLDHERLRYEVRQLRTMLRAFMSSADDRGLKPFCKFQLTNALTTSEASEAATLVAEYGAGRGHGTTSITVYNLETRPGVPSVFQGDANDVGYAFWDPALKRWYIFQMECP